jgi:hypothetical protein
MYYVRTCAIIVQLANTLLYFLRKKCKNAKAKNTKMLIAITLLLAINTLVHPRSRGVLLAILNTWQH